MIKRSTAGVLALDFSEHHFVKTRREFFGSTIGRHDEGTIIGYEDVAISQLVANLLNQLPVEQPEQYTLLCFGTYRNRQLLNVATGTISNDAWEGGAAMSTGQPYLEMSSWRPAESTSALSLLLYQLPPDQRPWRVALGVQFLEEPFPQRVSSFTGSTLFGLAALEEGFKDFEPDRPGFYVTSWSDVIPGYYFGLIWS